MTMTDPDLILGENIMDGRPVHVRLSKAPHILVAGMTGSGKSVLMHDLICQMVERNAPSQVSLMLIDPKRVEFATYCGLPHLVSDPSYEDYDIVDALGWANSEMKMRFAEMARHGWRDASYGPWPRFVIVVDELANLMLKGKKFERPLIEIASMGRAAGVHLILATQRPDATVINGLIRANVPTRVALPTFTGAESRIILDVSGAEDIIIPERLIRLPGERGLIKAEGRFWQDMDIQRTTSRWARR